MMPVYSVEKPGFPQILTQFDSCYKLPTWKYFSQVVLPVLYAKLCNNVESELQGIKCDFASTDLWSSKGLLPYISYTTIHCFMMNGITKPNTWKHFICLLTTH